MIDHEMAAKQNQERMKQVYQQLSTYQYVKSPEAVSSSSTQWYVFTKFLSGSYWFLNKVLRSMGVCYAIAKGQLNSEWIYEVIVSPKMPTKIFPDFCPTKQTRIVAIFLWFFGECRQFFWLQSLFVW